MSRLALAVFGGMLVAGLAFTSTTPADAGKACYSSSASAGWLNQKSASGASERRLTHAINAEAHKRKWKVVYVAGPKTSCTKSGNAWYKCASTAKVCSSK